MKKNWMVIKASGEKVPFSPEKLAQSLKRAGADEQTADSIIQYVESELYDEISTKKIYTLAFRKLQQKSGSVAGRYKLKAAIMELGPSGFAFEKFIGEIFKYRGYQVKIGQIMQGKCISHEIDVIADKPREQNMVECKYHNRPGIICDVKIPLYVHSRFRDVVQELSSTGKGSTDYISWIATNTRFSDDAIKYASCSGIKLLGWDFPRHDNLKEIIDNSGLYPITCINGLTSLEKSNLMEKGIILSRDLLSNKNLLAGAGVSSQRSTNIIREVQMICTA
jgi:hypothetical protein